MKKRGQYGFTIVELLVVIIVIAILATISIVMYTGVQSRAEDAKIKDVAQKMSDAITLWAANNNGAAPRGGYDGTGTNSIVNGQCTTGTAGWAGLGVTSSFYTCTVANTLVASNYLSADLFNGLPYNTQYPNYIGYQFMFYACTSIPNDYILYYTLQNPTASDTANMNSIETKCGASPSKSSYNMRGAYLLVLK